MNIIIILTSVKNIITEFRDTHEAHKKFDIPDHLRDVLGTNDDSIKTNCTIYER